jgi:hypothetical protein
MAILGWLRFGFRSSNPSYFGWCRSIADTNLDEWKLELGDFAGTHFQTIDGDGFEWAIEYDSSSKMVDWVEARNPSPTDGVLQSQNCWRYLLFCAGHLSLAIVFV